MRLQHYFYKASICIVGALFVFSGLIKLNDPLGTAIKLEEYFAVFAADGLGFFDWFRPLALCFALLLVVAEVILGVALLVGYRLGVSLGVVASMVLFFTCLTFYSAYFNKVTDCGCFGDAIVLTPWQSFGKDLVLLVLVVAAIVIRRVGLVTIKEASSQLQRSDIYIGGGALVALSVGVYVILFLPFIDFRPYKLGRIFLRLERLLNQLVMAIFFKKMAKKSH